MRELSLIVLLPLGVSIVAVAIRERTTRARCLGLLGLTVAVAALLFAGNRQLPSVSDFVSLTFFLLFPVTASFVVARWSREHSRYLGALLLGPLAFLATAVFIIGLGIDLGWIRK